MDISNETGFVDKRFRIWIGKMGKIADVIPVDRKSCAMRAEYGIGGVIRKRLILEFSNNLFRIMAGILVIQMNAKTAGPVRTHGKLLLKRKETCIDTRTCDDDGIFLIDRNLTVCLNS